MNHKTILIIEDDPHISESLSEMLSCKGYNTIVQDNGLDGIDDAVRQFPDLIICDIMMPGANGYEVIQALKNHKGLKGTPFIFISAKSQHSDIRDGMSAGADDYLVKPFKASDLFDSVETRLQKSEDHRNSLNELQEEFIEMANHEFRTPLTSIAFAAGSLSRYSTGSKSLESKKLAKIQNQVKKISDLIECFLVKKTYPNGYKN